VESVQGAVRRADDVQRRKPFLAFPLAVLKKFGEDRAGQLAALIAYYGFFSLFPLLLVFVTLTAMLFKESDMQDRLVDAALSQFPVIGDQLKVESLSDKGVALALGIGGALWAGLAGIKAAQNAMDHVWDVPMKRQPSFFIALLRAVLMLLTLGVFVLLASFLGGVAAGTEDAPVALRLAGIAGTLVLNFLIFLVAYRVLTVEDVSWRDVFVGAIFAGIVWTGLQTLGGFVIGHKLESAEGTYGPFVVVIGLLTWIYLGAQVTLLGAEMNVVRARRLWPRALDPDRLTEADERALRDHAKVEERREEETVHVQFGNEGDGAAPQAGAPPTGAPSRGTPPLAPVSPNGARGTGPLLRSIAADLQTLVSKQIELAKQEIGEMVGTRAKVVGVFGAAAVLGLFLIGFLGMAGAEALDLVLPRWAAMLIMAGVFGVLAAIAIVLARGWLRSSASKPELTQESLKEDVRWAKQQLKR
jgi:YihY family inner membrane protein